MRRLHIAQQIGDIAKDRLEVFGNARNLICENPAFGFSFMSFTNFELHGKPNNQYLEVWQKTGLIGLRWHLSIIVSGAAQVWKFQMFLCEDLSLKRCYSLFKRENTHHA